MEWKSIGIFLQISKFRNFVFTKPQGYLCPLYIFDLIKLKMLTNFQDEFNDLPHCDLKSWKKKKKKNAEIILVISRPLCGRGNREGDSWPILPYGRTMKDDRRVDRINATLRFERRKKSMDKREDVVRFILLSSRRLSRDFISAIEMEEGTNYRA